MVDVGERVRVHCVGRLEDGSRFMDTRRVGEPLEFAVGSGVLLPRLEKAIGELSPGESETVHLGAAEAYGAYDATLIEEIPAALLPDADALPVGRYIEVGMPTGPVRVKVLPPEGGMVRLDHNHELAGHDVAFEIELLEVVVEDAVEHELHGAGCACGCDRLKESLAAQSCACEER